MPQETLQVGRLRTSGGGPGPWLVLDAAHTAASAQALAATLRRAFPADKHRLAMVLAMAADKDVGAVTSALRGANPALVAFTSLPIAGSMERPALDC